MPDEASFAATAWLRKHDLPAGPATGAAFWAACRLAAALEAGTLVAIQGDAFDIPVPPGLDTTRHERALDSFAATGLWRPPTD